MVKSNGKKARFPLMLPWIWILEPVIFVTNGYGESWDSSCEKSDQSQSRIIESQFKKQKSRKLKMLGSLYNQTVNLETDFKTLHTVYWN